MASLDKVIEFFFLIKKPTTALSQVRRGDEGSRGPSVFICSSLYEKQRPDCRRVINQRGAGIYFLFVSRCLGIELSRTRSDLKR